MKTFAEPRTKQAARGAFTPAWARERRSPVLSSDRQHISRILRPSNSELLQRQEPAAEQKPAGEEPGETVMNGLKTVAENLPDKLTKQVTDGLKTEGLRFWSGLSTADRVALGIGAGVFVGTGLAPILADENARSGFVDFLEGKNLALVLKPIPYMPLQEFSFQRPASKDDPLQLKMKLTAKPYLDLLRERNHRIPELDASFWLQFGVGSDLSQTRITGGGLSFNIYKGIGLSAGTFTQISALPEYVPNLEGGFSMTKARFPEPEPLYKGPGFQFMLSLDLVKLGQSALPDPAKRFFQMF